MVNAKDPVKVERGIKAKRNGGAFELRVRHDLESKGWTVDKWSNNIIEGRIKAARHMWRGPNRPMVFGVGFPDFCCFRTYPLEIEVENDVIKMNDAKLGYFMDGIGTHKHLYLPTENNKYYEVIGVESKSNGNLSKEEKEKCKWYLKHNTFSKIYIAKKTKVKGKIVVQYKKFEVKDGTR